MFTSVLLPLIYLSGIASAKYTYNAANAVTINKLVAAANNQAPSTGYSSGGSVPAFIPSYAPAIESIGSSMYKASLPGRVRLRARSVALESRDSTDFECEDAEACILGYGFFMCVNLYTYDFQDTFGGKGNLESDVYTMKNGEVTTIVETATALPTVAATNTASTADAADTTTAGAVIATASANAASSEKRQARGAVELSMLAVVLGAAGALSFQ